MKKGISGFTLKKVLTDAERKIMISLLQDQQLPVSDIDEQKELFIVTQDEKVLGTAGLESFGECALLRSVSVIREEQGKGYGAVINKQVEHYARKNGINCLYLLTTTAKDFFIKQGYTVIHRDESPEALKQTAEFSSLCPSSAVVMKKWIS